MDNRAEVREFLTVHEFDLGDPAVNGGAYNAHTCKRHVRAQRFALVLASPLQRARETCALAGLGGQVEIDRDLAASLPDTVPANVRVVQGLRGGLDRRAIDAVRQWKFSPARRHGPSSAPGRSW